MPRQPRIMKTQINLALKESKLQSVGYAYDQVEEEQLDLLEKYDQIITKWAEKTMKKRISVKPQDIFEVLSSRTGVPVKDMSKKDSEKMLGLFKNLNRRVVGQKQALQEISESILRSKSGLQDPNKPVGSFLLVGASGTGKTHISILYETHYNTYKITEQTIYK